jgi:hypothetical protein
MEFHDTRTLEWTLEPDDSRPIVPVTIEPADDAGLYFEIFDAEPGDSRLLVSA